MPYTLNMTLLSPYDVPIVLESTNDDFIQPTYIRSAVEGFTFKADKEFLRYEPSPDGCIYRGILSSSPTDGHQAEEARRVVCKIALGTSARKRLTQEAATYYGPLRHLQGTCIPECYGVFRGQIDGTNALCLIMDDCGNSLINFFGVKWSTKKMIVNALLKVHRAGINYGHFFERHVTRRISESGEEQIFIIDFTPRVRGLNHICACPSSIQEIQVGVVEPWDYDDPYGNVPLECDRLTKCCALVVIWFTKFIQLVGKRQTIYLIEKCESEADVEKTELFQRVKDKYTEADYPQMRQEIKEWMDGANLFLALYNNDLWEERQSNSGIVENEL